ncbi:hypothetical protein I4U23_004809 [Adineta vaga]|nr:hypothetical protein I4U23_004809 [Adineta vaga]
MLHLMKFVFSIHIRSVVNHFTELPSSKDIQGTFASLFNYQIISYMDYFERERFSQCHMYSQNRLYNELCPFKHEFFFRISQSFLFLKILVAWNDFSQNHNESRQPNDNSRKILVMEYSNLKQFYLSGARDT